MPEPLDLAAAAREEYERARPAGKIFWNELAPWKRQAFLTLAERAYAAGQKHPTHALDYLADIKACAEAGCALCHANIDGHVDGVAAERARLCETAERVHHQNHGWAECCATNILTALREPPAHHAAE